MTVNPYAQSLRRKASFHKYQNAPYQTDWAVRENQLSLLAEFLCANSDAGTIVPARNLKDRKTTLSPSDLHFLFYTKVLFSLGFRKSKDPTHPPIHMMSSRLGVVSEGWETIHIYTHPHTSYTILHIMLLISCTITHIPCTISCTI